MIAIIATLYSCQDFDNPSKLVEDIKKPPFSGDKIPFSIEVLEQAMQNLQANQKARVAMEMPNVSHNYVRFEPQNLDQIMLIHDLGYELWTEPLHIDTEYTGDTYQDPTLPDSLNYFYSLIPVNYSITQEVPYSLITQLALFDEDAGDEQDPETIEDPWVPDPEPGYCYDEWGQVYMCDPECIPDLENGLPCPNSIIDEDKYKRKPEDLLKKNTKELLERGVNLTLLYNEMMRITGNDAEIIPESKGARIQSVRYYPSGCVKVRDNSINMDVPVKNVRIKSRRWFKLGTTNTNSNGCFNISTGYRDKVKLFVKFKNDWAKVRGISGALKVWEYVSPLKRKIGEFNKTGMHNISHFIPYNSNAETMTALHYSAAHAMNSLFEFRQYCNTHALPNPPSNLNIWVSSKVTSSASAPMLRSIANTSMVSNALDYLLPFAAAAAKRVAQNYLPDVTMRIQSGSSSGSSTRNTSTMVGTFYHEYAHAIHYGKVGNNYWASLIGTYIVNNGYGTKTSIGAGRTAVVESWAYFLGPTFTTQKYSTNFVISSNEQNFLERQRRDDSIPVAPFNGSYSRGWIPWGMLHDLMDTGEPAITLINDQVSGYTINGIFKGFHSGSTDVQQLKSAILANNNNSQVTQVNTLVNGYGW